MKKIILLISTTWLAVAVSGQINYGAKAGAGTSTIIFKSDFPSVDFEPVFAINAGAFVGDTVFRHFFWESGLSFSKNGGLHVIEYDDDFLILFPDLPKRQERLENLFYVNVPFKLHTNLLFPDWLKISAGINNGFLLHGISHNTDNYSYLYDQATVKTHDLGLILGASLSFRQFTLEFEWIKSQVSFTKDFFVGKKETGNFQYYDFEHFNESYLLSLKYRLNK